MMQIRPVSDLRNKFPEIETEVNRGEPVYLTKNGYGAMVVLSLEKFAELTEASFTHEEVFTKLKAAENQIEKGEALDAKKALLDTRAKYGI
ncbi:MAG: type II toxin-antitoxin system prevent-host-death family antitoxin [Clostridiales bacterium]|jgi:prevent-host-death family protein|nr:type II toxin-antitoxin system prevent-host-death family antitoxin [Clostridiales bacterium]